MVGRMAWLVWMVTLDCDLELDCIDLLTCFFRRLHDFLFSYVNLLIGLGAYLSDWE